MGRTGLITMLVFGALVAPVRADVTVQVGNDGFTPREVTIVEGESVNWVWATANKNSVTSVEDNESRGSFDSDKSTAPDHPQGFKFSHAFEFDGRFEYFSKTNTAIRGVVIVQNRSNNSTPPPVDDVAPAFSAPRVSVAKRRATFSLSEPAKVTAKLRGAKRRNFSLAGKAGRNVLRLPKRLPPGRYTLTLSAEDPSGNFSRTVKRKFRVRKKR